MKRLTVDRIEGEFAVCETDDGRIVKIPILALPDTIAEGDVVDVEKNSSATDDRTKKIEKLMNDVWSD